LGPGGRQPLAWDISRSSVSGSKLGG
jgi:hypothetical protein